MATTKTVNVTTGKFLNYQVTKTGYKPVTGSIYVDSNKTLNINMVSLESSSEIYSIGDRFLGISSFVCYYKPGGDYDNKPISTTVITQTVGSGIANLGVKKGLFEVKVNEDYSKAAGEYNYEFSYDGTNWSYDSNTVDLADYGIFFNTVSTTLSSGDKINVRYNIYNKYACFVLDANYRTNAAFANSYNNIDYGRTNIPNYPDYSSVNTGEGSGSSVWYCGGDGQESATWCNETVLDNRGYPWSGFSAFKYCRDFGSFIMANGVILNALLPNMTELYKIWLNRVTLDSIDPIIQGGSTAYNLTGWNFEGLYGATIARSCQEYDYHGSWCVNNSGNFTTAISGSTGKWTYLGVIPVFEVPCM